MNITKISVTWGETQSLPDYCNVKPSVTLEAEMERDDDHCSCIDTLREAAQELVRAQVDEALEAAGLPAKYSAEPRYKAYKSPQRSCIVIIPNELSLNALSDGFNSIWGIPAGARREHLMRLVNAKAKTTGAQVIDCADGYLSRIPPLPEELDADPEEDGEELEDEEADDVE